MSNDAAIGTGTGEVNLQTRLVDTYIVGIPRDPNQAATSTSTGYTICQTAGSRVQIDATRC